MKKILLLLLISLVQTPAYAKPVGHSVYAPPSTAETVTANLAATGATFPVGFVSWADELTDAITNGYINGTNTSLCNLAGMLGPNGTFQQGGNAADTSTPPALTQAIANNIGSFVTCLGSGWTLTYALSMCMNNPTLAVTQAGYLINALGLSKVDFIIGQEPPQACGAVNGSQANYTSIWNTYYTALTTAYPGIQFEAPEITNISNTVQSYVGGLSCGVTCLQNVLLDYYPFGSGSTFTPAQLLATVPNPANSFSFSANTSWAGGKMRMGAIGSNVGQGTGGYSNTLMSGAWYSSLSQTLFANGWNAAQNWNVFNANGGVSGHAGFYNFFSRQSDGGFSPYPVFYDAILISKLEGQVSVTTTKSGTGNVAVLSTVGTNGNANILVTNLDTAKPVVITPDQSNSWSTASVLIVSGGNAGCWSQTPTLGGQSIPEGGTGWTGAPITINSGGTITLQPCDSAVVTIQP